MSETKRRNGLLYRINREIPFTGTVVGGGPKKGESATGTVVR